MKRLVAAATVVCLALLASGAASAKLIVGVNDDVVFEYGSPTFYMPTMQAEGLKTDAVTIRWDETAAAPIDPGFQADISTVIDEATAAGVTVELDLYPLHSQV